MLLVTLFLVGFVLHAYVGIQIFYVYIILQDGLLYGYESYLLVLYATSISMRVVRPLLTEKLKINVFDKDKFDKLMADAARYGIGGAVFIIEDELASRKDLSLSKAPNSLQ
jgi:hypothetical protein